MHTYYQFLIIVQLFGGQNMSCSNKLHFKIHAHIMRLIFSTTSDNAIILQKEQKWLTCSERDEYHTAKLVFKTKCNCLSTYMFYSISFSSNSVYGLKSIARNYLNLLNSRTNYMKYSFQYYAASIWNAIHKYIRCCRTSASFKNSYKLHLLNMY